MSKAAGPPEPSATSDDALIAAAIAPLRRTIASWGRETSLGTMRADYDAVFASRLEARDIQGEIDGMPVLRIQAGAAPSAALIVYAHGGGYRVGSTRSHRDLMIRLARAAGCDVLGYDYRLAPEHVFPAAVEDAVGVWRGLLAGGQDPARTAFVGESAGAGLSIAAMVAARDRGLPLPAAAALMSAWLDLEASSESYRTLAAVDPLTQRPVVLAMARTYLGRDGDPRHPLASPVHADLRDLPPTTAHVGSHETVLDDSRLFVARMREAGRTAELRVWDRMIHHFQLFPDLPETERSLAEIAEFLGRHGAG